MKLYLSYMINAVLIFNAAIAQPGKYTIYLDENWSICEKPVAEYYRIASVKADKELVYVGDVADYYIGGAIEMRGFYDDKGMRNGHFTFYTKNGKKSSEGNFAKDEMVGIWNYYGKDENLKVQLDCKSAVDFTPILIINSSGDTILKNGNGQFTFNSQNDLPQIFPGSVNFTLEGQVINGKKEGEFKYWINRKEGKAQPFCTDVFKNGIFKRSKNDAAYNNASKPCNLLNLLAESKLLKTDFFTHSNLVFGFGSSGEQKLIKYLMSGELPEIKSEARSYSENIKDIYNIIGIVLRPNLMPPVHSELHFSYPPPTGTQCEILFFAAPATSIATPRIINSEIILTIDTGGYVNNSVFKGNLNKVEINKINYYLSRLSNLIPFNENGRLKNSDLKLRLITLLDTPRVKTPESLVSCTYLVMKADSLPANQFTVNDGEKPASFVGGPYAWRKYLERNLNALAPSQDKAPSGTYTVKVEFVVDEEGNVSNVQASEASKKCPGCIAEAERVIREGPKWEPAMKDGKKVKFQATQMITFMNMEYRR